MAVRALLHGSYGAARDAERGAQGDRRGPPRRARAKCPGLKLRPKVQSIKWPRGRIAPGTKPSFRLKCSIDCKYTATVVGAKSKTVLNFTGRIQGTKLKKSF